MKPLISLAQIEQVRNDMHASGRKLMTLGFKPKVTWREAIYRTSIWWKQKHFSKNKLTASSREA